MNAMSSISLAPSEPTTVEAPVAGLIEQELALLAAQVDAAR